MRGTAHAHLVECDDGHAYVVKLPGNPQGTRILANELIASVLLGEMGIATPQPAIVQLDCQILSANPDVSFHQGNGSNRPRRVVCFGSRFPGCPARVSVFDMFPRAMLAELCNRFDFLGALVVDKWLSNSDSRQAIYFRTAAGRRDGPRWIAQMIDNGHAFFGSDWLLGDSQLLLGHYPELAVYGPTPSIRDFEPWIERLRSVERAVLDQTMDLIPSSWIGEDRDSLQCLLDRLWRRRDLVPSLVEDAVKGIRERVSRCTGPVLAHLNGLPQSLPAAL